MAAKELTRLFPNIQANAFTLLDVDPTSCSQSHSTPSENFLRGVNDMRLIEVKFRADLPATVLNVVLILAPIIVIDAIAATAISAAIIEYSIAVTPLWFLNNEMRTFMLITY